MTTLKLGKKTRVIPMNIKRDHMKPVLTIHCVEDGTGIKSKTEFFVLYPGDNFTRFGGSSRGLMVTKTPSIIKRYMCAGHCSDTEYNLEHGDVWQLLGTFINGLGKGWTVTASPANEVQEI